MKRRSRRLLVASIAIAAATCMASCSCPATNEMAADWPYYSTLDSALAAADVVIVGKTLSSRESLMHPEITNEGDAVTNPQKGISPTPDDLEDSAVPITITTVEVIESLNGGLPEGTTIEVDQPGTRNQPEVSTALLEDIDADEMVLLLSAYDSSSYGVISPEAGVMKLEGDRITALQGSAGHSSVPLVSSLAEIKKALRDQEDA